MVTKGSCGVEACLVALVLCAVSACSGGGATHATGITAIGRTTPGITKRATAQACTAADLSRPLGNMPNPEAVRSRFVLDGGYASLDAPGKVTPKVTGTAAWLKLTRAPDLNDPILVGGGRARLLLGYLTSPSDFLGPNGTQHILVWVIYKHPTAVGNEGTGPGRGPTGDGRRTLTTVPPVCRFGTSYAVLNATTGQWLWSSSGVLRSG
jgi:hypothetical protein